MNRNILFSAISLGKIDYKINDKEISLDADMVIPCYFIEKIKKYNGSDDSKLEYEVVPIISIENLLSGNAELNKPIFDDKIICQNSIFVDKIFVDFDQGRKELDHLNLSRMVSKVNSEYDFQLSEFMNLHKKFENDMIDKYDMVLDLCEKNLTFEDIVGEKYYK